MEKQYDSDFAKARSRDLVGKMLDTTLLTFRKPKDVRVLHFGGINLAEAKQIYLPRGILPSNIISVERDRDIAEVQESLGTGIKVVNADLEEYVNDPKNEIDFDVISLDYIGPITKKTLDVLGLIADKQRKNQFVLHHANLLRRDGMSKRIYMNGYSYRDSHLLGTARGLSASNYALKNFETIQSRRREFSSASEEDRIKDVKSASYTPVLRALFGRTTTEGLNALFKFTSGNDFLFNLAIIEKTLSEDWKRKIRVDPNDVTGSLIDLSGGNPAISYLVEHLISKNVENMCSDLNISKETGFVLNMALFDCVKRKPFFRLADFEGYSYISESGAPMIGDVMFLRYPVYLHQASVDVYHSLRNPSKLMDALIKYSNASKKFSPDELLEKVSERIENREFLGNSSKPVLSKRRAIEEFESGASVEEVQQKYRGWTNKPLAQWKAHVSMGTYSSRDTVINGEDSDLEKITKEDAIDFLSSGVPCEEIYSCYPTSFSIGQLRAYKKHVTMGTYAKK